jgi:hypothetical protein
MSLVRILAAALTISFAVGLLASPATAQNKRNVAQSMPQVEAKPQVQAKPAAGPRVALVEQKCLRAANGNCTDPSVVQNVRLRAQIIPSVRVSYLGTPAGTIGGRYIPFERLYQDNQLAFGLRTFTFVQPCCTTRSK